MIPAHRSSDLSGWGWAASAFQARRAASGAGPRGRPARDARGGEALARVGPGPPERVERGRAGPPPRGPRRAPPAVAQAVAHAAGPFGTAADVDQRSLLPPGRRRPARAHATSS